MARAGPMRHRVTFERRSTTQDASGESLDAWELVATRWAALVPQSAREFYDAQRRHSRITTLFRMRKLDGLVASMRATWDGRLFDVVQVLPTYGNEDECLVLAEEIVEEAA